MSIRDLAVQVGLSPGSVYHHFSSKLELLSVVLFQSQMRRLERGTAVTWGKPPEVALVSLIEALWQDAYEVPCRAGLSKEARYLVPNELEAYLLGEEKLVCKLEQILMAGVNGGNFQIDDVHKLSRAVISLTEHFAIQDGGSCDDVIAIVRKLVASP